MIFVQYDEETLLPLNLISANVPDFLPQNCTLLDAMVDELVVDLDDVCILDNLSAVVNNSLAASKAKERALLYVRNTVAGILAQSDTKMRVLDENLRIDRSNESTIEAWFSLALSRQQIRDSSNDCQEAIENSVSQFEAWEIAKNFSPTSAPLLSPAPEITKNAFLRRLNLSFAEKVDPVFQALTSDLVTLGYVDLRQSEQTINFLVSAGKLTRERADQILRTPVRWGERPIHGV